MYKDLSSGIKSSITRSINTSLEQYFTSIEWDADRFAVEDFVTFWRAYFQENAAWYDRVSDDVLASEQFHEELAKKINDGIAKMLGEEPTVEQVAAIDELQQQQGTNFSYDCKAEAAFIEAKLKEM